MPRLLKLIFGALVSLVSGSPRPTFGESCVAATASSLSSTSSTAKILELRPISLDYAASLLVRMAKGVDPGSTGYSRWLASCRVHTVLEVDFAAQSPRGQKADKQGNP